MCIASNEGKKIKKIGYLKVWKKEQEKGSWR